jgi:hypothetical protein
MMLDRRQKGDWAPFWVAKEDCFHTIDLPKGKVYPATIALTRVAK